MSKNPFDGDFTFKSPVVNGGTTFSSHDSSFNYDRYTVQPVSLKNPYSKQTNSYNNTGTPPKNTQGTSLVKVNQLIGDNTPKTQHVLSRNNSFSSYSVKSPTLSKSVTPVTKSSEVFETTQTKLTEETKPNQVTQFRSLSAPATTRPAEELVDEIQLLQRRVEELEKMEADVVAERDSVQSTITQLTTKHKGLESKGQSSTEQLRRMELEIQNMELEISMMVEQINQAFKEQIQISAALERYNDQEEELKRSRVLEEDIGIFLKNKISTSEVLKKENKELQQTVQLLEAKYLLLKEQHQSYDKQISKDQEKQT
eukprot:TRINITY_DN1608_c0_g1_i4.p1 TRINITY_DN1608_c0_g1~~TRINITY_DN1608_c0_g1_i4.p1  ORF type:complete len:313 (-),score=63.53 TRINITY_DN1608_c0_g1_i4:678-1616(-)